MIATCQTTPIGQRLQNIADAGVGSASPVIVKIHHITVSLVFLGGKWSKLFPGENFKVHRVTWLGRD